jgi:hypothetical protein
MREVIPKRELQKLDEYFGIDQAQINKKLIPRQRSLFDLVQQVIHSDGWKPRHFKYTAFKQLFRFTDFIGSYSPPVNS